MSQAPFVPPKARGRALHGQLSEGLQHVDLHDYILHDHIFRNTEYRRIQHVDLHDYILHDHIFRNTEYRRIH